MDTFTEITKHSHSVVFPTHRQPRVDVSPFERASGRNEGAEQNNKCVRLLLRETGRNGECVRVRVGFLGRSRPDR